jgi:hypothetical protein
MFDGITVGGTVAKSVIQICDIEELKSFQQFQQTLLLRIREFRKN